MLISSMVFSFGRLSAISLLALTVFTRGAPADNPINPGFPYGSQKVRGVNLGGWLVLEVRILARRVTTYVRVMTYAFSFNTTALDHAKSF